MRTVITSILITSKPSSKRRDVKRAKAADVSRDADGKSGERFDSLMSRIVRVSKEELIKRETAYQDRRRGKKIQTIK